jgi:hypothetical protein
VDGASCRALREDAVAAVRAILFHFWAVKTVDEGIALLPDTRPEGARRKVLPSASVHGLVVAKLEEYAERLQKAAAAEGDGARVALP